MIGTIEIRLMLKLTKSTTNSYRMTAEYQKIGDGLFIADFFVSIRED
jgi:hypothetical protein